MTYIHLGSTQSFNELTYFSISTAPGFRQDAEHGIKSLFTLGVKYFNTIKEQLTSNELSYTITKLNKQIILSDISRALTS